MAQDIYSKYQQPVSAPDASADADIYSRYQRPDSGTPPDAGVQMRNSALAKIGASMPTPSQPGTLSKIATGAGDLASGAGQGAASTIHGGGGFLQQHVPGLKALDDQYWKMLGHPAPTEEQWQNATTPKNTLQTIGKGVEQAGEFLIPGGAEEKAASLAARGGSKILPPLARTVASAAGAGLVNKAQGGDFSTGAEGGAIGSGIGQGLVKLAPKLAESALGIQKLDRTYGKAPGVAALEETSGVRPSSVATSARGKLSTLNSSLDKAVKDAPDLSLARPIQTINNAESVGMARNAKGTVDQLSPIRAHLTKDAFTGAPIPESVPAPQFLNLKRGLSDEFIHNSGWNPNAQRGVVDTAKKTYHDMADVMNTGVEGARELNGRIASLIPVAKRAESLDQGAGIAQKAVHRIAAHTGAGLGGAVGGYSGYREGGLPGAVAGAASGLLIPELLASPTTQMGVARLLHGAGVPGSRLTTGAVLPLLKQKDKKPQ